MINETPVFKTMVRLQDGSAVPYEALKAEEKTALANIINEKAIRGYAKATGREVSITYDKPTVNELNYKAVRERAEKMGFIVEDPNQTARGTA